MLYLPVSQYTNNFDNRITNGITVMIASCWFIS